MAGAGGCLPVNEGQSSAESSERQDTSPKALVKVANFGGNGALPGRR
jgi:hypothetical protein